MITPLGKEVLNDPQVLAHLRDGKPLAPVVGLPAEPKTEPAGTWYERGEAARQAFYSPGVARIVFFLLASVIRTYATGPWDAIVYVARVGLTITLFLIGASLSRQSIAAVGVRPMLLGVILWIVISTTSLFAVLRFIPSR